MATRKIVRFGENDSLFGVLHLPENEIKCGLAVCAPFGEEAKSAYRAFYEFADMAASRGLLTFRFDYFGTGNSAGGFEEFCPERARLDIPAAIELLRANGAQDLGLLGLGIGGSLACEVAAEQKLDALVLWQPVVSGEQFHKLNIKRQLVRQMLTHGKAKGAATAGELIDLDGYPLRKSTAGQLKQLDLLRCTNLQAERVLLVQISHSQTLAADLKAFAEACSPPPETAVVVCEPFWQRIGFVDCGEVYEKTLEWLEENGSEEENRE